MKHALWIGFFIMFSCSSPKKQEPIEEVSLGVQAEQDYPQKLSEWNLYDGPIKQLDGGDGMLHYTLNAPLFSDYAHKKRFIRLPKGTRMGYQATEPFDFPEGTVLVKNFYYPSDFRKPEGRRRILETRLLVKKEDAWKALVYQWNEAQTEAERVLTGAEVPVEWRDEHGTLQRIQYSIPSQPQCKSCHDFNGKMTPIGPTARQLHTNEQLDQWHAEGLLESLPVKRPRLADYRNEQEALNARARAWLEINCAHCHRKEGPAKNSGLYLLASQKDPYRLGVKKAPIAAGRGSGGHKYGIMPGQPDQSILVHRIESLEPGEMMPELGRKMTHEEGVALIRQWIEQM